MQHAVNVSDLGSNPRGPAKTMKLNKKIFEKRENLGIFRIFVDSRTTYNYSGIGLISPSPVTSIFDCAFSYKFLFRHYSVKERYTIPYGNKRIKVCYESIVTSNLGATTNSIHHEIIE